MIKWVHSFTISLILLLLVTRIYAQDLDLIVTIKGDSIACRIDSITETKIYFEMKSQFHWRHTHIDLTQVRRYEENSVNKEKFIFETGSTFIDTVAQPWDWDISFSFGAVRGWACKDIEAMMEKHGFDDTQKRLFRPKEYPQIGNRFTLSYSIQRYFNSNFSLAMLLSYSHCGDIEGNHNSGNILNSSNKLEIRNSVITVAPILKVDAYDPIGFGAGPSINIINTWKYIRNDPIEMKEQYYSTKLGFILDMNFRLPIKSPLFFKFDLQYRYIGKIMVGPFTAANKWETITIDEFDIRCSHITVSIVTGARF